MQEIDKTPPTVTFDQLVREAHHYCNEPGIIGWELTNPLPHLLKWIRMGPYQEFSDAHARIETRRSIKLAPLLGTLTKLQFLGKANNTSYFLVTSYYEGTHEEHVLELLESDADYDTVDRVAPEVVPEYMLANYYGMIVEPQEKEPKNPIRTYELLHK